MAATSSSSSRTSTGGSSSSHNNNNNKYRWHRRSANPNDIPGLPPPVLLKQHTLPLAAYLQSNESPPGLDVSQPLLLYRKYTATKVRAASLQISRDSGLLAVGPTLVIPDSYTGWFSVVTAKGRSASYHSTIEDVAKAQPSFFLTRYDILGYIKEVDSTDCNRVSYRKFTIPSGHVLKLLGIFEDLNTRKSSRDSLSGRSKYIQCLDYCNETLFVPFSVTGKFYETAQKSSKNVNQVFLMSQILNSFHLPLTVRLVCGFMPRVPQAFTGILRLEKIEKEAVILACTITAEAKATLLEMDISSNFLLKPITDPMYAKTPIFLKSVSYCSDEADSWQRQIKVIHHVTEDESFHSIRRASNNTTMSSTSSLGLNLPIFNDFDKIRGRARDRSKTREDVIRNCKIRDKSKDVKMSLEKNKENRESEDSRSKDSRSEDSRSKDSRSKDSKSKDTRSKDSKLKIKVKEKIEDLSRNRHYVVNDEFISIRMDDKLSGKQKGFDNRKVSKQNTYIFQNEKLIKQQQERRRAESETTEIPAPKSIETQEYATVLDEICYHTKEITFEASEYAEICEHKTVSDSKHGIVRSERKRF